MNIIINREFKSFCNFIFCIKCEVETKDHFINQYGKKTTLPKFNTSTLDK